jgi:Cof subfamily protein (haloacid dehalogenase superfamily)
MIKLIAMDMDDTVLNSRSEISGRTKQVIKAAVEKGIAVTFATGRMYSSCRPFALELSMDVPLITYNGALIQRALSDEVLFHQPVPLTAAQQITRWAEEKGHHLQAYVNDRVYVCERNEKALWYGRHAGVEIYDVGSLVAFLQQEPTKMLIMAEPHTIDPIMGELQNLCGNAVHMARSKAAFLEIVHPTVSKGIALKYLAEQLGISRAEVMAVGDGYNDLEMLEYAGVSVAMGNAHQHVKDQADYVTESNENDGVARAIERLAL